MEERERVQMADKLASRIEALNKAHVPAPTCQLKKKAHAELITQLKKDIAQRLDPKGVDIEIKLSWDG